MIRLPRLPADLNEARTELVRWALRCWRDGHDVGLIFEQLIDATRDHYDRARPFDERPTVRRDLRAQGDSGTGSGTRSRNRG